MKTSVQSSLALAVASVFAASGAALAASPKLKGTYAEAGETVCLISTTVRGTPGGPVPVVPSGFNPDTLAPNQLVLPNGAVITAFTSLFLVSVNGVRTFDGEGSGTHQSRNVSINSSPNIFPNTFVPTGSSTDLTGTFTYDVAPDGTISVHDDTFANILSGPRAGQTATNRFELTGRASNNRDSLVFASDAPRIETISFSNGDVQERLCKRSRSLIRTGD
jgi:hypothetical protein